MNRYFLPSAEWQEGSLILSGDEARHCARVMRARVGDQVEIFDGSGSSAIAEIETLGKSAVECRILTKKETPKPQNPITLCQAIPKGGNMELIVQKAVELGVAAIQPLITEHTVARPGQLDKKQLKWQRIALEACKQCGQNHLPEVLPPRAFAEWIAHGPRGQKIIAALHPQAVRLKKALKDGGAVNLLIGPEGDFSPREYEVAIGRGFTPASLGDIVLRTETAALYCLSVIRHELG